MFVRFTVRIVLPTVLTVGLFAAALFWLFLPALERNIMERKREMIRELTQSAWNILANLEQEEREGRFTRAEAQAEAVRQVRNLHYGPQLKDYFWINDLQPRMVAHPYRHDLEGQDLSAFRDPSGKRLFVEFVQVVRRDGAGYVAYQWQHHDDPTAVVPKISYVKGFAPWGWIIGTGVYVNDVRQDVRRARQMVLSASLGILALMAVLLAVLVRESLRSERARLAADAALRASEERYRLVVESAGESILMELEGDRLYANANALRLLGYDLADLAGLRLADVLLLPEPPAGPETAENGAPRHEAHLRRRDGSLVPVLVSQAPFRLGARPGRIVVATDITQRKAAEAALGHSEAALRAELARLGALEQRQREDLAALRQALALLGQPTDAESPLTLAPRLRAAATPAAVAEVNRDLPGVIRALLESGAGARALNQVITANTDAVVARLGAFALAQLGPPPAPFAFLILGSEGRREQTLRTDQDNAIVYADVPAADAAAAQAYFLQLGQLMADWLNQAGYAYCSGDVMARNPAWCLPLPAWERRFRDWMAGMEADDLLQVKLCFDFRHGFGDPALPAALRRFLAAEAPRQPRFLGQLALNVLQHAPPLGAFGRLVLEPVEGKRRALDVKAATIPVVDFARLYALRHGLTQTNTLDRLDALLAAGVLEARAHREIVQVYDALMRLRLAHQVRLLEQGRPPDNALEPDELTYLDRRILRESFANIRSFQSRLGYEFTGLPRGAA